MPAMIVMLGRRSNPVRTAAVVKLLHIRSADEIHALWIVIHSIIFRNLIGFYPYNKVTECLNIDKLFLKLLLGVILILIWVAVFELFYKFGAFPQSACQTLNTQLPFFSHTMEIKGH